MASNSDSEDMDEVFVDPSSSPMSGDAANPSQNESVSSYHTAVDRSGTSIERSPSHQQVGRNGTYFPAPKTSQSSLQVIRSDSRLKNCRDDTSWYRPRSRTTRGLAEGPRLSRQSFLWQRKWHPGRSAKCSFRGDQDYSVVKCERTTCDTSSSYRGWRSRDVSLLRFTRRTTTDLWV